MLMFGPNVCIFSRISFFNVANEKMEYISILVIQVTDYIQSTCGPMLKTNNQMLVV